MNDRIVCPQYVFVTSEYVWSANVEVNPTRSTRTELKEARRTSLTRHEGFELTERAEIVEVARTIPQERIPKRILDRRATSISQSHATSWGHACLCWTCATLKIQQVVNTVEVKTLKILKQTMHGEKVDPDDDPSHKDLSDDQTGRDSSDSVLSRSRSPEFRKSHSKSRTREDQPKIVVS